MEIDASSKSTLAGQGNHVAAWMLADPIEFVRRHVELPCLRRAPEARASAGAPRLPSNLDRKLGSRPYTAAFNHLSTLAIETVSA